MTPSAKLSVAVMCSPAMVPMPCGEGTTSVGVMGWPSVVAVATTLWHGPATLSMLLIMWVPMFIRL